jgi:regulatory protein
MAFRRNRTTLSEEQRTDASAARAAAVALLARRDFAGSDLCARLKERGFDPQTAAEAVAGLDTEGLVNDARYAENYATWHAGRGQGPLRIAADLRGQGVAQAHVEAALAGAHDWTALARKVCRARFGAQPPQSWPEKARQARFLQYRGFSSDHIRAATGADPDLD